MTELDVARPVRSVTPLRLVERPMPTMFTARLRSAVNLSTRSRIAAVAVVSLIAYSAVYVQVVTSALAGSRTAYLLVVPVLLALTATGYRSAPRGVNDSEADWIIAAMVAIVGFTGIHLLAQRTPTLAGLWQLPLFGALLVCACSIAVLFSVRHVAMMWAFWLFAVCALTPWPYLVAVAALGGSNFAAALVAAALGTVAVFLAGRPAPVKHRLITTAVTFGLAAAAALVLSNSVSLPTTMIAVAGVIPVLSVALLNITSGRSAAAVPATTIGRRRQGASLLSMVALAAVALGLLTGQARISHTDPVPTAPADWAKRSGLQAATSFPFITRFLGPDATLVRYDVPARAGFPAAAVDVMSSNSQAALGDYADAVWYPMSRPVDYRSFTTGIPLDARVIHTDADAASDGAGQDWYAVTWMWRTPATAQVVTVIVSQTLDGEQAPPSPAPLSFFETTVHPAMWIARQQPDADDRVDPLVSRRAEDVIRQLTAHVTHELVDSGA